MTNRENGNGEVWSGMPWQVKAVSILGLPTIASVAFAWVLIVEVRSNQKTVLDATQATLASVREYREEIRRDLVDVQRALRAACLNEATTERAAQNCEDPWLAQWPQKQQEPQQPQTQPPYRRRFDR
jgi:hypothetical protein